MAARASLASFAQHAFLAATFLAGALLFFEQGLYGFALGLVAATLGVSLARDTPSLAPSTHRALRSLWWLSGGIVILAAISIHTHAQGWDVLDNFARLLLLPWCAWLACITRVPRAGVWWGAVIGVAVAFVIASSQIDAGMLRAGGADNPIVFANLVLVLASIVLLATPANPPHGVRWLSGGAALLAGLAIVFSGSRGNLTVWCLLAVFALIWQGDPHHRRRRALGWMAVLLVAVVVVAAWPGLHAPLRLDSIGPDLARFQRGDANSPIGARLQFLSLAWQSFLAHPWTGVGIEGFGQVVRAWSGCRLQPSMGMCELRHAHNDLAEWSATLGLPGLVAVLCLYGVPLAMFLGIIRRASSAVSKFAARAGVGVVMIYVLCGWSQSMFAHAATATAYALFVGVLLGMALRESNEGGNEMKQTP